MINKAILIGRLGKAPEIRDIGRGDKQVCNLRVATSKKIKGEEFTQWHAVTVWGEHSIKYLEDYADKGSIVYIEGEIETRKYEKDGRDVYVTEIIVGTFGGNVKILSDFKERDRDESRGERNERGARAGGKKTYREESGRGREEDYDDNTSRELDDEIPF